MTTSNYPFEEYPLNENRGITNIGSHPDNDIVISDARVLPFHFMLDHRQKPYRVIALSPDSNITVDGIAISSGEPIEVMDLSHVKFNGFSLNIDTKNGSPKLIVVPPIPEQVFQPTSSPEMQRLVSVLSDTVPQQKEDTAAVPSAAYPMTSASDIIILNLSETQKTADVEQPSSYRMTIINGGPIVATFDIAVTGVPESWVEIFPRKVNLNESGRAAVDIRITPPRDSSSRAGEYPLDFTVTSPNYPGKYGQVHASLTINPYYQYAVGNLNPRQRTVTWGKRIGLVNYPIINQGNSQAAYHISALDDENGLQFEFPQENNVSLARQADIQVEPGETREIPIKLNPVKRSLIRLRGRHYNYNITTQSTDEENSSRIINGTLVSRPLFGIFHLLAALIILLVSTYFICKPRITEFSASKDVIETGQPVTLKWKVSFFTTDLSIEGVNDKVTGAQNQMDVVPTSTATTYTLVAGNWLSHLLRMENVRSDPITVLMIPTSPTITTFSVDKTDIFEGDTVNLKWSASNADRVLLTIDGVTETLPQDKFNGEKAVTLRKDSLIVMEAKNSSGSLVESEFIKARKPSINIEDFSLSKTTITVGDSVTIKWKVSGTGVESVNISPFTDPLPLQGELTFFPTASMEFVMTIKNRDLEEIRLLPIGVLDKPADPTPPTINFFKAAPASVVGKGKVEFSWSVSGITDKIEITDSSGVVATKLDPQGFNSETVGKTTNFVLTAYNGTVSKSQILEVAVTPALRDVAVSINSTIPTTSAQRGSNVRVYFSVKPLDNDGNEVDDVIKAGLPEVSGKVTVTDGYDSCTVELPQTGCAITVNTSDTNKKFTATYTGDSNYNRRTSDPYPSDTTFTVVGAPAAFATTPTFLSSTIVVGETTTLSFLLQPADPAATDPVTGNAEVWELVDGAETDTPLCTVVLKSVTDHPTQGQGDCEVQFATKGTKVLRIKYMGNQVYDGKTITAPDFSYLTVNPSPTNASITSQSSLFSVVGELFTVNIKVLASLPGTGTPTGTVTVYNSAKSTDSCLVTLADGIGSCSMMITSYSSAAHYIIAQYHSDGNYADSTSFSITHYVNPASTTTTITSISPDNAQVGQNLSVNFAVSVVSPGSGIPTGTVTVNQDSSSFCSGVISSTGTGQCTGLLKTSGAKSYQAYYVPASGDYSGSYSPTVAYTVAKAGTSITITGQEPLVSAVNQSVKFSFAITTAAPPNPSGLVILTASSGETCQSNVSGTTSTISGSCNLTFLTEGTQTITASFRENSNYAASTSNSVSHTTKKDSTVTIVSSDPATTVIDQTVSFEYSVVPKTTSTINPTGTVVVTASTAETCSGLVSDGRCNIIFKSQGNRTIVATYQGDDNFVSSSSPALSYTVSKADTDTTLESGLPTTAYVGQSITVKVKVASVPTTLTAPTGSALVSAGTDQCTATITNGAGQCLLTLKNKGTQTVAAAYTDDSGTRYNSSTSDGHTIIVDQADTVSTITQTSLTTAGVSPDTGVVGQPVTVSFQVVTKDSSILPTSSTVEILAGSTVIGSGTSSGTTGLGTAEITFSSPGTKQINAHYVGTTSFKESTSVDAYPILINKANTTLSISNISTSSVVGQEVTIQFTAGVVSPGTGTLSGKVNLTGIVGSDSAITLCSNVSIASDGTGSCSYSFAKAGNWNLSAAYSNDPNFKDQTATGTHTVGKSLTSTTLSTLSPTPVIIQTATTINYSAQAVSPGSGTPTGTVTIYGIPPSSTTEQTLCSDTLAAGSCNYTFTTYGAWKLRAEFTDSSGNYDTSTSSASNVTVKGLDVTISLQTPTSSSFPADAKQTFSATVTESDATFDLSAGITIRATSGSSTKSCNIPHASLDTSGNGSCDITFNKGGIWSVIARYDGDANFELKDSSAVSVTANKYASTLAFTDFPTGYIKTNDTQEFNLALSITGGSPTPTGSISVTATLQDVPEGDPPVVRTCGPVTIDGTTNAGKCSIQFDTTGTWKVVGAYSNDDLVADASTAQQTLLVADKIPTSTQLTANPTTVSVGDNVLFTVKITAAYKDKYPAAGDISISGGPYECVLSSVTHSGNETTGSCTIHISAFVIGSYDFTAIYAGDSIFAGSTSPAVTINVNP
jgi:hypothetical protein